MKGLKKRYRVTVWAREPQVGSTPTYWRKLDTRELDKREADLLQGFCTNFGWHWMYRACDKGFELAGRLVTVEALP